MTPKPNHQGEGGGRPSEFTQEMADTICVQISTSNRSIRTICAQDGFPSVPTFYNWLNHYPKFLEQYARAKESQADWIFEEILEIADTCREGVKVKTSGEGEDARTETQTGDMVERSKLQVDARKWVAARLAPKKYGDRMDLNHSGDLNLNFTDKLKEARERAATS